MRNRQQQKGFTLIELLVVITILGVLASVILSSLGDARTKSEYARVQSDLRLIELGVTSARGEGRVPLIRVTGSNCSDCSCRPTSGRAMTDTACINRNLLSLERITAAANGDVPDLTELRDPWGNVYVMDENEDEVATNLCRADVIRSAGKDGVLLTADDYGVLISFKRNCP